MWTMAAPLLTNFCLFLAVPAPPADHDAKKVLAALEQKMLGEWNGGACDGRFFFRADGTYELTGYGPGASDSRGVWKIRWDALPPTLVLTTKTAELEEEIGKTLEVKLIRLDDKSLAIEYANSNGSPSGQYARAKK